MKALIIFLTALASLTAANAQDNSPKEKITVDGKTFEKWNGIIYNKNTEPAKKKSTLSEYEHSMYMSSIYLLTKDSEIKNMFKAVLSTHISMVV